MSNENNSRLTGRDELDIDSLIRSIRSPETEPEQPAQQPVSQQAIPKQPVTSQPVDRRQPAQPSAPAEPEPLQLDQPHFALTREEREDWDPNVQQMRSQLQSVMAAWGEPSEETGRMPVESSVPEPQIVGQAEMERAEPVTAPSAPVAAVEEPTTVLRGKAAHPEERHPSSRLLSLFRRKQSVPAKDTGGQVLPESEVPQELERHPGRTPEPAGLVEQLPPDFPQPEPVGEQERQAFEQGQVITLRLHRVVENEAPTERQIFNQEEDIALEAMLADNARAFKERQEAEAAARAEAERIAAGAQRAAAEAEAAAQAEAERIAAEARRAAAEAEQAAQAAETAAAEEAAEEAAAELEPAPPVEPEHPAKQAQPFQMVTLNLRRPAAGTEGPAEPQQIFDQDQEEPSEPLEVWEPEAALPVRPDFPDFAEKPVQPEGTASEEKPGAAETPVPAEQADLMEKAVREQPLLEEPPAVQTADPKTSHRVVEQEDEELEAMLSAHAGPVDQPAPTEDHTEENLTPPEQPDPEPAPESQEDEPRPALQTESEVPEQSDAEVPAEELEARQGDSDRTEDQPAGEPEEDWEDGVADESLLERPDQGPGLIRRLAGLAAALLQRPNRKPGQDEDDIEEWERPEQPEKAERQPTAPAKQTERVVELPREKSNPLRRKLEEVEERANDFADGMFQGESEEAAEEEKLHQHAERYIPGTDEERMPRQKPPKKAKKKERPVRRAPDTSPKELSRIYYSSWKSGKGRQPFQLLLALALIVLGALAEGELPFVQELVIPTRLAGLLLTAGLVGVCILSLDTLLEGIFRLFRGHPGLNTLASMGVILTVADGIWYNIAGREGPLPFCGFAALSLWSVVLGNCRKKRGLYQSCQMAAAVSQPQRLTLDQGKWDSKGTFIKTTGTAKGFGSQIQQPDGAEEVYRYAAPVMIAACFAFGILAAVGQGGIEQLVWNWSVIFVLATPLASTLAYGAPYAKLVKRLNRSGVILAGWEGANSMKGEAGIAINDSDLFPEGSIQFNGIKNFGKVSLEKLTGCTASVMREMDTGLAKLFDDLIRTQGGFYRRVDDLKVSEGGFSGLIRGDQVLVGNADYMNLMHVPLQQGYQVRNAVFCVINGELQGIFALNYTMAHGVPPALDALIHGHVNPILATRDFNITPTMLRQRFRLPVDRMEYPPVDRRQMLSAKGQPHNQTLGALIYREGLRACTDAILGGRRLRTVVRLNTILTVAASVVGALLGFYLTMMGAYYSLSPLNILFFLVMWLLPILLISSGVDQF